MGVGQRRRGGWSGPRRLSRDIEARGKRALFVGGTPLYLKALLHGLFDGAAGRPGAAAALEAEAERAGSEALHAGWPRSTRRRPRGCTRTTSAGWSGPWRSGS